MQGTVLMMPIIVLFSFCVWDYMPGFDLRSLSPRRCSTGQPLFINTLTDVFCSTAYE